MQIREQGKKIQLIRSIYNKETKICDQKLIGTVEKYGDKQLTMHADFELREDEREQLQKWLDERKEQTAAEDRKYCILSSDRRISDISNAIKVESNRIDTGKATKIYAAIDELTKTLRKAGFKRPEKPKATKEVAEQPLLDVAP